MANSIYILFNLALGFLIIAIYFLWQNQRIRSQLADRTRALEVAHRINKIVLGALDFEEVAQKIADTIPEELKFGTSMVAILDPARRILRRVAASKTAEAQQAIKALRVPFNQIEISLDDPHNLMARSVREGKLLMTDDIYNVLGPVLDREEAGKIQRILGTKTILIYPLMMDNNPIGVFVASTKKRRDELSRYEFEIIQNFVENAGIALQHATLYKKIKDKSDELAWVNQQVSRMNDKLSEVDKLKDDFVSIASHELRTPMTAIRSYAWMALNRSDVPLSEKLKKYLSRTLSSTERLINLVSDMLNISRIESGKIEIIPQVFDIRSLVEEVCSEVSLKLEEKSLHIQIAGKPSSFVFADPDKVHQVLLNLLGNSIKFTPAGGNIMISCLAEDQMMDVAIKDSGVGISQDDLPRLFKKFGRLDNSYVAAAASGGTGLGLYISKSLVELMGGKIWVGSEGLGKGATFTFSLPLASQSVLQDASRFTIRVPGQPKYLEPAAI